VKGCNKLPDNYEQSNLPNQNLERYGEFGKYEFKGFYYQKDKQKRQTFPKWMPYATYSLRSTKKTQITCEKQFPAESYILIDISHLTTPCSRRILSIDHD